MIEIKVDDRLVLDGLKRLAKAAKSLRPAMRAIAGIMADAVEENFEQQGRPRWKPLAPSTIAGRREKGYWPGKILQRRGELAASIEARHGEDFAAVGTNKAYAAIHQLGGRTGPHVIRPRLKKALAWPGGRHPVRVVRHPGSVIPARPFLTLGEDDKREILQATMRHIEKAIG